MCACVCVDIHVGSVQAEFLLPLSQSLSISLLPPLLSFLSHLLHFLSGHRYPMVPLPMAPTCKYRALVTYT